jgi:hypothetical protein
MTSIQNGGQCADTGKHLIHEDGQLDDQRVLAPDLPLPSIGSAGLDMASESGMLTRLSMAKIAECLIRNK